MSKQERRSGKIAEASTLGSGGKSDSYCIPILDNHTNTKANSAPAPFPISLSALVFVCASLSLTCTHPTFVLSTERKCKCVVSPLLWETPQGAWIEKLN